MTRWHSIGAREALARVASGLRYDFSSLLAALQSPKPGQVPELADREALWLLASALLNFPASEADLADGEQIFGFAEQEWGVASLDAMSPMRRRRASGALLNTLWAQGRFEDWSRVATTYPERGDVAVRGVNLSHPAVGGSSERWLAAFNSAWFPGEWSVELTGGDMHIDSLAAGGAPHPAASAEPLVSVVVPTYNTSTPVLVTAVRSILEQTHRNLELIIVDDCSTDTSGLDHVRGSDPRIQIVRTPSNAGTYRARNLGMRHATGEFIAFHDSDDWCHPLRIATQLAALQARPELLMIVGSAVMTGTDLYVREGYDPIRAACATMMMPAGTREELGDFDPVRKGADTEYIARAESRGRERVLRDPSQPVSVVRRGVSSLSSTELVNGWVHPARAFYRQAWRRWHSETEENGQLPRLNENDPRPFPAPASYLPSAPSTAALSTAVMLDCSLSHHAALLQALLASEAPTDICVVNSYPVRLSESWHPSIWRAVRESGVRVAFLDEDIEAKNLLVLDGGDFHVPPAVHGPGLRFQQAWLYVPPEMVDPPGQWASALLAEGPRADALGRVDLDQVTTVIHETFGVVPRRVTTDEELIRLLTSEPEMTDATAFYASQVELGGLAGFATFAAQARSVSTREVLIRAASGGQCGPEALERLSLGVPARLGALEVGQCDRKALLALATLMGNQRILPTDIDSAINLFRSVENAWGPRVFSGKDRVHYLELLSEASSTEEFFAAFEAAPLPLSDRFQALLMAANLCNPWDEGDRGDARLWLTLVGGVFNGAGLEPIDVAAGAGSAMDRILCASYVKVTDGPSVSVLIPTHNPGSRLGTALSSLVSQTWSNCEFLIVDDGSDGPHAAAIDRWASYDQRIRVLRVGKNVGTYAARNIGLQEASGEFVTVHDDDDWSHPRKLETQARHLLANPGSVANMSRMVRATSDLHFTRIGSSPLWIQPNYSSLMFRREEATSLIGYWDEVNRGGDSEYRDRLRAVTGEAPPVVGEAPLSMPRVRGGSLTSGQIHRGYMDPRRTWYVASSRDWHTRRLSQGEPVRLGAGERPRAFTAPLGMTRGRSHDMPVQVDAVYATDYRLRGSTTSSVVSEIESMLQAGMMVGLLQLNSPVLKKKTMISPKVLQLAESPGCVVVSLLDPVIASLVIVRHPTVLQFLDPRQSEIQAQQGVLVIDQPPARGGEPSAAYDIDTAVANFAAVFGLHPQVAPVSHDVRAWLEPRIDTWLAPFDWSGSIAEELAASRKSEPQRAR